MFSSTKKIAKLGKSPFIENKNKRKSLKNSLGAAASFIKHFH
jgi:hypothetical protein